MRERVSESCSLLGPPDQKELSDLTEKAIPLILPFGVEWFGDKLGVDRFHTSSIKHEERTLYAQVNRLLHVWKENDEENDRKRLAELLSTMNMYTLAVAVLRHEQ